MPSPTLSTLERSRIAAAAKLAAAGAKVCWRNVGRRLAYVVEGKEHLVFTNGSDPVHWAMVEQAKQVYQVAVKGER